MTPMKSMGTRHVKGMSFVLFDWHDGLWCQKAIDWNIQWYRLSEARQRGFKRDANYSDDEAPVFEPSQRTKELMENDKRYYSIFISPYMEDLKFRSSSDLAEVVEYLCEYFPDDGEENSGYDKAQYMVYCKLQELYYADSKRRHMEEHEGGMK